MLPLALITVLLASDAWVYADAQRHTDSGRPVEMSIGSVRIDTPVLWTLGCLLLWIVFLPLYITQRTHASPTRWLRATKDLPSDSFSREPSDKCGDRPPAPRFTAI